MITLLERESPEKTKKLKQGTLNTKEEANIDPLISKDEIQKSL